MLNRIMEKEIEVYIVIPLQVVMNLQRKHSRNLESWRDAMRV